MESAIVVTVSVCIFLAFYFAFLSINAFDKGWKEQFVILAAVSLLAGLVIFICLTIYWGIQKVFVKAELSTVQESQENVDD